MFKLVNGNMDNLLSLALHECVITSLVKLYPNNVGNSTAVYDSRL